MDLDVMIFGGGAAGLWLLDALVRAGARALLCEANRLGSGQTIAAQGIIHGGLKYTLQGMLTPSAVQIREMPRVWRECLAGRREPNLSGVRVRAGHCYLWRTDSLTSRLGMLGARVGLRVMPESLARHDRPPILAGCPGGVARLEEQVISPHSLLETLLARHRGRIIKIDPREIAIDADPRGCVRAVRLADPSAGEDRIVSPRHVVLASGQGNAELRRRMGFADDAMQRRPLHMVLLRGDLPELNGHCVDGASTRVTITSDRDACGRTVWQVGGQIAEIGTTLDERTLILRAKAEIEAALPGIDRTISEHAASPWDRVEWSTYRVDRAEGAIAGGARPETIQLRREGNVLSAWPTKLALVPLLAERIVEAIGPFSSAVDDRALWEDWQRPEVALPPWETPRPWFVAKTLDGPLHRAA